VELAAMAGSGQKSLLGSMRDFGQNNLRKIFLV